MVRIAVVAVNGRPPVAEIAAEFGELGGSIGRDGACTLVLVDPEKRISRRHATIVLRDGRYVLQDQGTATPALVNGRAVGSGHEAPLAEGDRIEIGSYAMLVTFAGATPQREALRADRRAGSGAGATPRDRFGESAVEPPRALPEAPGTSTSDALLTALLAGAGVRALPRPGPLTPEFMHLLGLLLRTAIQGTIDLLRSRAVVKSGLHAQVTVISARENNPVKFSPTAEAALCHLLGPDARGFMMPVPALEEAYRDLVSHQLGIAAGMRAALAGVVGRFDPAEIERKLAEGAMIDALLPGHRKAKLWDLYAERFTEVSGAAEEDFHQVLGREFLDAYESRVAELKRRGGAGDQ